MVIESIDDSRLKVALSINRPNVRAKVICEYMYCMHACRKCERSTQGNKLLIIELDQLQKRSK